MNSRRCGLVEYLAFAEGHVVLDDRLTLNGDVVRQNGIVRCVNDSQVTRSDHALGTIFDDLQKMAAQDSGQLGTLSGAGYLALESTIQQQL
jgi:hypothetical protein